MIYVHYLFVYGTLKSFQRNSNYLNTLNETIELKIELTEPHAYIKGKLVTLSEDIPVAIIPNEYLRNQIYSYISGEVYKIRGTAEQLYHFFTYLDKFERTYTKVEVHTFDYTEGFGFHVNGTANVYAYLSQEGLDDE